MRVQEQLAFVLHRRNYSESSLLVEVFTREHGRIGLMARAARGTRSALPALLQPFQRLSIDYAGSGELPFLRRAEPAGAALLPLAEASLAGLYYNELLMRMLPRSDAHLRLFEDYDLALQALLKPPSLAFSVRRFERRLLDELGYGIDFRCDVDGAEIDLEQRYEVALERGFRLAAGGTGYSGNALRAIDGETIPTAAELRELRMLFKTLIRMHLTGEPLRSWSLMAELRG